MSEIYIGCDNGKSGALAVYDGVKVLDVLPYPTSKPKLLYDKLVNLCNKYDKLYIAIEKPFTSRLSNVTTVNFEVYGRYLQCFDILGLSYTDASPKVGGWRPQLGFTAKGRDALKVESIERALKILDAEAFISYEVKEIVNHKRTPVIRYNDNFADAINLAVYAKFLKERGV